MGDYRAVLKAELSRRKVKNPRYSLRAFARDLDLDSSGIHRVLLGKTGLSLKAASQIAGRLQMPSLNAKQFMDSVAMEQITHAVQETDPKPACENFIILTKK